ncbi:DUF1045 domain-containing protein [Variovorax sp. Sphag1AA]|uniref:DUF1045 domain-containing protein n=1 Tax=Variovorax sp. Sphag1AA TaxID=2587027 RepID=UPI001619E66A|nr:DUF1045 domain-containing protein [Variovorax sp. Sphag1AA]MBB3178161.1 hypothetical protein [Variovorax sp. Sphag1AA]
MTPGNERYAIYWAPDPAHPLWAAGCDWLGRDPSQGAGTGLESQRPNVSAPARYGFHATLKAPIRLAAGRSFEDLRRAAAAVAKRHRVFEMPTLHVAWLQDFVALRPVAPLNAAHPLRQLADACVGELDEFRAPAPANETARRAAEATDADAPALALLARWGYTHVFDGWRFHMTLSDRFDDRDSDAAKHFERDACAWFSRSLAQPLHCTALCIFHEPAAGAPFRLIERLPLEGAA